MIFPYGLLSDMIYGDLAWLIAIIILLILIVGSSLNKYLNLVFIPASLFLGFTYLSNLAVNSDLMWIAVIMFIGALVQVLILLEHRK